jgi:hypothetical protein
MEAIGTDLSDSFTINPSWLHKDAWNPAISKRELTYLIDVFTPSFSHSSTQDPLPNQMAANMIANTYLPKSRGRKALPGYVEGASEGGNLVTAAVTRLVLAVAQYLEHQEISTGNELWPGVPDADGSSFLTFRDGVANTIMGTCRRRKPGVGA